MPARRLWLTAALLAVAVRRGRRRPVLAARDSGDADSSPVRAAPGAGHDHAEDRRLRRHDPGAGGRDARPAPRRSGLGPRARCVQGVASRRPRAARPQGRGVDFAPTRALRPPLPEASVHARAGHDRVRLRPRPRRVRGPGRGQVEARVGRGSLAARRHPHPNHSGRPHRASQSLPRRPRDRAGSRPTARRPAGCSRC